jgi:hypothetical protein
MLRGPVNTPVNFLSTAVGSHFIDNAKMGKKVLLAFITFSFHGELQ